MVCQWRQRQELMKSKLKNSVFIVVMILIVVVIPSYHVNPKIQVLCGFDEPQ